jgi:hypothetical protein
MSGAHTPGPWDFGPGYEPGKSTFDLYGPGGRQVIACASYENMWLATYNPITDAANARLIAAAPELLEALTDLLALPVAAKALDYLDRGTGTKTREAAWLRARVAIATATRNSGDEG